MEEKTLGRYTLVERIAIGGMAEVYRAELKQAAGSVKTVCIKKVLPQLSSNSQFISMFIDEAKITLPFTHSNITSVFEFAREGQDYYLSMEFVEGMDLDNIIELARKAKQELPIPMAVFIASEIALGLNYAHEFCDADGQSKEIIHRDVSPQNVLVSYQGDVKLTDFGVAKARSRITSTVAGVIRGKLMYMSPEQAGGADLDPRSDQFSLGLVLYEMLTQVRPFEDESEVKVIHRAMAANMPMAGEFRDGLDPALETILHKALSKEAANRYQNCAEFAAALKSWLNRNDPDFRPTAITEFIQTGRAETAEFQSGETDLLNQDPEQIRDQLRQQWMEANVDPSNPGEESGLLAFRTTAGQKVLGSVLGQDHELGKGSRQVELDRFQVTDPHIETVSKRSVFWGGVIAAILLSLMVFLWTNFSDIKSESENSSKPNLNAGASPKSNKPAIQKEKVPNAGNQPEKSVEKQGAIKATPKKKIKKVQYGRVKINSEPWAYVSIDGKPLNKTTPIKKPIRLKAGMHTFKFRNTKLKLKKTVTMRIKPNRIQELKVKLK